MSIVPCRQSCAEPWLAQSPVAPGRINTGEAQMLAVLLEILAFGNLYLGGRLSSTTGTSVLAGLSTAPAAAHVQGIIRDQQGHRMCINFKCTINDTFFPWMRHVGCDAQPQGNVSSEAGAAQAALTWVSSELCPCSSTLLLCGSLWGSQLTPNALFAL